jgi:hypothetical protein
MVLRSEPMKVLIWCCGFEPRFAGQYVAAEAKRQGYNVQVCGSRRNPRDMLPVMYEYKPDVVLAFPIRHTFGPFYELIRRMGAKLVLWYPDMTETRRDNMWRRYLNNVADGLIFSIKETAHRYSALARTVLWMPQYFDANCCRDEQSNLPKRLDPTKEIYDLCFIGSCDRLRNRWLDRLEQEYKCLFLRDGIKRGREVRGYRMAEAYAQSKIAFNIQREMFINPGPFVTSNRTYNAMGSGAFFINHHVEQLDLVFQQGVDCEMHDDDLRHLRRLIDRYLVENVARERIARTGQEKVLRYHSLEQRVKEYWTVLRLIHEDRAGELPAGAFGEWVHA